MEKHKKNKISLFLKLNGAFFTLAYSFMFLSFGFYLYSKSLSENQNKKDIQINVINPQEVVDSDITIESKIRNLIPTSALNPNLLDLNTKKKILETVGKENINNYYVVINKDGLLNPNLINIQVGDTVTFLNSSGVTTSIMGEGWGVENLEDTKTFTQEFYIPKKHLFKLFPFNIENSVIVDIKKVD